MSTIIMISFFRIRPGIQNILFVLNVMDPLETVAFMKKMDRHFVTDVTSLLLPQSVTAANFQSLKDTFHH